MLALIVWAWAALAASVVLYAALRQRATARAREDTRCAAREDAASVTAVLLLRPCAGLDPHLPALLASTADARTHHRLAVRLSAARPDDAAWPAVEAAAHSLASRGLDARAQLAPTTLANHKCGQLAALTAGADAEVFVVADADVDLADVDLDALVDPLLRAGGPAATYAPPIEVGPPAPSGAGDRASQAVLDSSLHAFPLLSALDPRGFVGKLFAVRRHALEAVGGFTALGDYLGEDMELARRLRAAGHRTEAVDLVAQARPGPRTLGATVDRYARWLAVIRAQRPALLLTYPLLFFPTAPLVALSIAAGTAEPAALAIATRVSVALAARQAAGRSPVRGLTVAIVLADLTLALAWLRALTRSTVVWRGRTLRLARGGRITVSAEP